MSPVPLSLACAHSPDSDDAYIFYALATQKVRSSLVAFSHILADIETLNSQARQGAYPLTAISYHAYPYLAERYRLMASGSSVGDGYGPILASLRPIAAPEIKGKRVAVPGRLTTAYLVLRLFEPDFEAVELPFDQILDAVAEHHADLGLVIHEGQLTYARGGFCKVMDLGAWWKSAHGLPLPLGANALSLALPPEIQAECCRLMRASIQYALDHHEEALHYAMQFARDMEPRLAEQFIGMYVNHYTLDCGELVPRAAQKLLDLGYEAGLVPRRVTVEYV
jgi:1,4-dihydroxy-6-naphthoate synthase